LPLIENSDPEFVMLLQITGLLNATFINVGAQPVKLMLFMVSGF
jgi:hypothetical protein